MTTASARTAAEARIGECEQLLPRKDKQDGNH
jgi:hypothetical protein